MQGMPRESGRRASCLPPAERREGRRRPPLPGGCALRSPPGRCPVGARCAVPPGCVRPHDSVREDRWCRECHARAEDGLAEAGFHHLYTYRAARATLMCAPSAPVGPRSLSRDPQPHLLHQPTNRSPLAPSPHPMARASAKFDAEDKPAPAKTSSVVSTNSLVSASWAHTIFFQALLSLLTVWLPLCAETTPTRTLLEQHRGMD